MRPIIFTEAQLHFFLFKVFLKLRLLVLIGVVVWLIPLYAYKVLALIGLVPSLVIVTTLGLILWMIRAVAWRR